MSAILTLDKIAAGEKFSVANSKRGHITVDGLRDLIRELRAKGTPPQAIILSYRDRRDLNDDVMSMSTVEVAKEDENREMQIAIIEGVQVGWNRLVENGRCIIVPMPSAHRGQDAHQSQDQQQSQVIAAV